MGLDISAYSRMRLVRTVSKEEWRDGEDIDADNLVYVYPLYCQHEFSDRAEGLVAGGVYTYEDYFGFRAGSYGGYNDWRAWLCHIILKVTPSTVWRDSESYKDKPFFGLINFSDCEGIIGPEWSARLAKDFADHQNVVDALPEDEGSRWFRDGYSNWRKAFELAADSGMVDFH